MVQGNTPSFLGKDRKGEERGTSIDEALRDVEVDSETKGVPGHPPVADTILKKIDAAAVFVADLTFVGEGSDESSMPNPNVLIEFGWALKTLTHDRVAFVVRVTSMRFCAACLEKFMVAQTIGRDEQGTARNVKHD